MTQSKLKNVNQLGKVLSSTYYNEILKSVIAKLNAAQLITQKQDLVDNILVEYDLGGKDLDNVHGKQPNFSDQAAIVQNIKTKRAVFTKKSTIPTTANVMIYSRRNFSDKNGRYADSKTTDTDKTRIEIPKELEETYRKFPITVTQLVNEKASLTHQLELLKDRYEKLEKEHSQLKMEHMHTCWELDQLEKKEDEVREGGQDTNADLKEDIFFLRWELEDLQDEYNEVKMENDKLKTLPFYFTSATFFTIGIFFFIGLKWLIK